MTRDISLSGITDTFQKVSTLVSSDVDHNDVGVKWKNVTITNDTDVAIQVKSTGQSTSPVGSGRTIAVGDSFNYLEVNAAQCWVKGNSEPVTGNITISITLEGGE
jgi:hypothetical protein